MQLVKGIKLDNRMKKITLVTFFIVCLPFVSYAASIGGALTQGKGKFSVGIDSDYVFKKEFKNRNASGGFGGVATYNVGVHTEIKGGLYRETVKLSYGIFDNLDIYAKVGMAQVIGIRQNIEGPLMFLGFPGALYGSADFQSEVAPAYGAGIKGKINFPGRLSNLMLGCDTQYIRHKNRINVSSWSSLYVTGFGLLAQTIALDRGYITWEEWHAAPYLAYKIGNFVPYVGGKYSYARMKMELDTAVGFGASNEKTGSKAGAFVGFDYLLGKHIDLNLEGRFIDETAVSGSFAYKF